MSGPWTNVDAWVFAAIANAHPQRRTLTEVIGTADAINHAIPGEAEFSKAVGRLVAAGLIEADPIGDRYGATETGGELRRRRWRHGLFGWMDTILPGLEKLGDPADVEWRLPEGAYEAALRAYQRRAHAIIRRFGERPRRGE